MCVCVCGWCLCFSWVSGAKVWHSGMRLDLCVLHHEQAWALLPCLAQCYCLSSYSAAASAQVTTTWHMKWLHNIHLAQMLSLKTICTSCSPEHIRNSLTVMWNNILLDAMYRVRWRVGVWTSCNTMWNVCVLSQINNLYVAVANK